MKMRRFGWSWVPLKISALENIQKICEFFQALPSSKLYCTTNERATAPLFDPADEEEVERIMTHVRSLIKTRRILLKPFFHDFDRANKGVYLTTSTTRGRFERALSYAGIVLTARGFKLLCDKYQVHDAGTESDLVRYLDFIRSLLRLVLR